MTRGIVCSGLMAYMLACLLGVRASGQQPDYAEGSQYFDALRKLSLESDYDRVDVNMSGERVTIVGCPTDAPPPPTTPIPMQLAVRVWGQLVDYAGNPGPFVNLQKHKWQRNERFYLWIDTAVPLQLSIFQNYPDGRPASRQVTPDPRFPATFATIMPGRPFRYPVMLKVDDDLRDEIISIIAVRADAGVLPCNGAQAVAISGDGSAAAVATNSTAAAQAHVDTVIRRDEIPPGGQVRIRARAGAMAQTASDGVMKGEVIAGTNEVYKGLNEIVTAPRSKDVPGEKLGIVAPNPSDQTSSNNAPDVDLLLLGPGNIAHVELIFHKD